MRPRSLALGVSAAALWFAAAKRRRIQVKRVARISRVVSDLGRAEAFYKDALGFRTIGRQATDRAVLAALGQGDNAAEELVMRLGDEEIALVQFKRGGQPYPLDSRSNDLWFQHLAVVVGDMDAAFRRLSQVVGWQAISKGGPQLLPPANGSVRAFKFRDPDGHPLELIWFPPGQGRAFWQQREGEEVCLGIDHSALSVSGSSRSLRFYRALGLRVAARSSNRGPVQSALDGLAGAVVSVTGLRPSSPDGMGLELLSYQPPGRPATNVATDAVTDWVTLVTVSKVPRKPVLIRDPDGHRFVLTA